MKSTITTKLINSNKKPIAQDTIEMIYITREVPQILKINQGHK